MRWVANRIFRIGFTIRGYWHDNLLAGWTFLLNWNLSRDFSDLFIVHWSVTITTVIIFHIGCEGIHWLLGFVFDKVFVFLAVETPLLVAPCLELLIRCIQMFWLHFQLDCEGGLSCKELIQNLLDVWLCTQVMLDMQPRRECQFVMIHYINHKWTWHWQERIVNLIHIENKKSHSIEHSILNLLKNHECFPLKIVLSWRMFP